MHVCIYDFQIMNMIEWLMFMNIWNDQFPCQLNLNVRNGSKTLSFMDTNRAYISSSNHCFWLKLCYGFEEHLKHICKVLKNCSLLFENTRQQKINTIKDSWSPYWYLKKYLIPFHESILLIFSVACGTNNTSRLGHLSWWKGFWTFNS